MTDLARALASSRTIVALLEAAQLARAKGAMAEEVRCVDSARLQMFQLRRHLDQWQMKCDYGLHPMPRGPGEAA